MKLGDTERALSYNEWKLLMKMSLIERKKHISVSELAEQLDLKVTHPYLHKLMKMLINAGVVQFVEIKASTKFLTIKPSRLIDFIDELNITQEFFNYFSKHHLAVWT